LNLGQPQPDGRTLTDDHWVYPGWQLRLPVDATALPAPVAAANSTATPAPTETRSYDVTAGESLWDIAAQQLGDGARYREIYDLSTHTPQPDGQTLTDPDLIRPGWHLTIPLPAPPAVPSATPSAAPTLDATSAQGPSVSGRGSPAPVVVANPGGDGGAVGPGVQLPVPALTVSAPSDAATQPGDATGSAPFTRTLVLGLTALAASGVAAELARRRRRQHRLRRAGERIPLPELGSPAETAERSLRRAEVGLTLDSLRRGLHLLGPACRAAGRSLPRVGGILLTEETIDLVLVEDDEDPVAPFARVDARTWRATHADFADQEGAAGVELFPHPFPALVTVGITREGAIMVINLEAAGVLSVNGPPEAVTAAMRALACELATSPLSAGAHLVLGPEFADLAAVSDPARTRSVESTRDLEKRSVAADEDNRGVLDHARVADALAARAALTGADTWAPTISLGANQAATTTPWSGHAVLTTNRSSPWQLEVDIDGEARLDALGCAFRAQRLPEDHYHQLIRALGEAAEEPARTPFAPPATVESQLVEVLTALPQPGPPAQDPGDMDGDPPQRATGGREHPRVLVLGPVTVTGLDTSTTSDRSRRNVELIAFLALQPGASAEQVDEVLGHGKRIEPPNRNAHISRARTWLGTSTDGHPYLLKVANHDHYRLDPAVHTDWEEFLDLSTRGLGRGPDGATDLRAALALVRGRPFTGAARGAYEWADVLTHEMIDTITDVAHALALVEIDARDFRGARHATAVGLAVDPCNEQLFRDAITAAHNAGDHDEVERLIDKLQARIDAIDPGCDLEDDTVELLETLQRT
ncbi:MAG: LysM peptidoglycan-binding domain-containing protein, partial [Cellulomonas sp.]